MHGKVLLVRTKVVGEVSQTPLAHELCRQVSVHTKRASVDEEDVCSSECERRKGRVAKGHQRQARTLEISGQPPVSTTGSRRRRNPSTSGSLQCRLGIWRPTIQRGHSPGAAGSALDVDGAAAGLARPCLQWTELRVPLRRVQSAMTHHSLRHTCVAAAWTVEI
eukprot:1307535-Prymnesium_polylepis.1